MKIAEKEIAATRIFTHEDLENFPNDEIWELIEGVPHQMTPPSVRHQMNLRIHTLPPVRTNRMQPTPIPKSR